jgi:hypothetical protein
MSAKNKNSNGRALLGNGTPSSAILASQAVRGTADATRKLFLQVLHIALAETDTVYSDLYKTIHLLYVSKVKAKACAKQLHVLAASYVNSFELNS